MNFTEYFAKSQEFWATLEQVPDVRPPLSAGEH